MSYVIKTAKTEEEAINEALMELGISIEDAEIEVLEGSKKGFLGVFGNKSATVKVSEKEDTKELLKQMFEDDPMDIFENETEEEVVKTSKVETLEEKKTKPEEVKKQEFKPDEKKLKPDVIKKDVKKVDVKIQKGDEIYEVSVPVEEDLKMDEAIETASGYLKSLLDALALKHELKFETKGDRLNIEIIGDDRELGIVIGKRGQTLDSIQYLVNSIVNADRKKWVKIHIDCSNYRVKREETLKRLAQKMAQKALRSNRPIKLEPMNAYERKIIHEELAEFEGIRTHSEGRDPYRRVIIGRERKY